MACSHKTCQCQLKGCGNEHPRYWKPTMTKSINGIEVGGDDEADCMAHYLLRMGYPNDRPDHLRRIAEGTVERHRARSS
jgi:hypothetical protein